MPLPSAFTELLSRLIGDSALESKNTAYDASLKSFMQDRVAALTPDKVEWYGAPEVDTVTDAPTGALEPDVNNNAVVLDTAGFQYSLSANRDGVQRTPRRIRRRAPGIAVPTTGTDRVRYIMAGPTDGVMLLDDNLEIVRTFPNFEPTGAPVSATGYNEAECAVAATPTTAAAEHLFVACGGSQHVVQIYNYATGAHVAAIGTPGTAGLPGAGDLSEPVSVAVDEANDRLFIVCKSGDAPGSDASDNGFVSEWDISTIGTPVFVQYHLIAAGLNKLNNTECQKPTDVFFVPGATVPDERLWVANGLGDVGEFSRALVTDAYQPTLVFEAIGPGYVLGPNGTTGATLAQNSLDVLTGSDGHTRLYVTADRLGRVEVFRVSGDANTPVGAHEASYGFLGAENALPYGANLSTQAAYPRDPLLTYGSFANASGVVADELTLPGDAAASRLLVVADRDAGRLQRLRVDVYEDTNTVTFEAQTSDVPVCVVGWFLPADASFHPDQLVLEVRDPGDSSVTPAIAATDWREVPQAGYSVPVSGPNRTRYQFRLRARLDRTSPVQAFSTGAVGVLLRQQW